MRSSNWAVCFSLILSASPVKFPRYLNMESRMNITLGIAPIISLLAGILILIVPRLLNFIVAIYLIIIGVLGLLGAGNLHL